MHRGAFKPVGEICTTKRLQLIHSDVCDPMQTESIGGRSYFVTFIDDYSRCCAVYFLKHKSEVFEKFKEFEAIVTNECNDGIKTLRINNGGEYLSDEFKTYLISKRICHEMSAPYTPQQNGIAERMNRTLMESAHSMLSHAHLPYKFWAEAVSTAAFVRNRTAIVERKMTPYERWYSKQPNISQLKVFGCICYALIPDQQRQKLDKKSQKVTIHWILHNNERI